MMRVWRWLCLCAAVILGFGPVNAVSAQPGGEVLSDEEIPPHLGYGVHYGPNTKVPPSYVAQLNFDWVKVYEIGNSGAFPGRRVLYRLDLGWPGNWTQFKADITRRMQVIARAPIDAIEVHNEPNLSIEWGLSRPNAWQYVQLLRVVYTIAKQVKPSLIVVSGGLAPTVTTPNRMAVSDLEFAQEMFENGAGQWFDAFGYHPYGYNLPPEAEPGGPQPLVFRRTEQIRALMEQYGIYKQIWLTEFGWLRDPAEDGRGCSDADPNFSGFAWMRVSGQQQADYLVRAFEYAHRNWPWAGPMFVWNLNWNQMNWLPYCSHMRWFGLLRSDGTPTLAFQRLARMKHYRSNYLPRFEVRLLTERLGTEVSLLCPRRVTLGTFTVENIGYPAHATLDIIPVNSGTPPFIQVEPTRVRPGEIVTVFADPAGLLSPGQYAVYINIRTTIGGRPMSQSVQGYLGAWHKEGLCG